MYSRQEASKLRQEFWTVFGQYMSPIISAEGERINWVNYKTGEKNISIRMNVDNKQATISIIVDHKDAVLQQIFFEQFVSIKNLFESLVPSGWEWKMLQHDDKGQLFSSISTGIDANVYNREQWPELISFFKNHMMALDAFWTEARYFFEALR